MRLLVSVRNAPEAEAALAGGADIVDAKEPLNGPLGPVATDVLQSICAVVDRAVPISVALGDVGRDNIADGLLSAARTDVAFVKIGLGGSGRHSRRWLDLGAWSTPGPWALGLGPWSVLGPESVLGPWSLVRQQRPSVVVVAYADYEAANTPSPDEAIDIAAETHATGILLDTCDKDGSGLTALMTPRALGAFVTRAREHGLGVALAGRLTAGDIDRVCDAEPDILGFRGAACDGGRAGIVSADRVRALRDQLDRAGSVAC